MSPLHSPGGPHKFTDSTMSRLRIYGQQPQRGQQGPPPAIGLDSPGAPERAHLLAQGSLANLVVYQVTATLPFTLDVIFESGAADDLRKSEFWRKSLSLRILLGFEGTLVVHN